MSITYRRLLLSSILVLLLAPSHVLAQISRDTNFRKLSGNPGGVGNGMGESHWNDTDTDSVRTENIPRGIYAWTVDERFGQVSPTPYDTLPHRFQNDNFTEGPTGHYLTLGNLGSARSSLIRPDVYTANFGSAFIFAAPYDFFLRQPSQLLFTNTKSPFTNITYHECGNKQNGEDRIRALFSTNVNKDFGLGFRLDYLYGRGYYQSQQTAHFGATLFASYRGERYAIHAAYMANHLKAAENGGIESDDYLMRPEIFPQKYGAADMPTRLSKTWNKLNVNTLFITHRYNLGFYKGGNGNDGKGNAGQFKRKGLLASFVSADSVRTASAPADTTAMTSAVEAEENDTARGDFVPVMGIIHTLKFDHNNRRFLSNLRENARNATYFRDFYLPGDSANDFTQHYHLQNLLALEVSEGFARWAASGLRLYVRHDYHHYTLPNEQRQAVGYNENQFTVGASLFRHKGKMFRYDAVGELRNTGSAWGEFNAALDATLCLPLAKDSLRMNVHGQVRNELPSFYLRHYHGRNAWWDTDLDKTFTARAGIGLSWKRSRLAFDIETIRKQAYLSEVQTPYTSSSNIPLALYGVQLRTSDSPVQVARLMLGQDFVWGILHWENELHLQYTSDEQVMPLPSFFGYSNIYLLFRIARVLRTEIGADARFYTKYRVPTYSPIVGQYVMQDEAMAVEKGGYPVVNAYINFHLKRTRFYLMASHVNYSSGKGDPFSLPHYPLNQMVIRMGLSWNFDN